MLDYFDSVIDGIEYLLAVGAIIGILGLLIALAGLICSGDSGLRLMFLKILVFSIILLVVCGGPAVGIKYFRIH